MGWSLSPISSILTLMIIKCSIDPTQETSKNSKSSKTQQKENKNHRQNSKTSKSWPTGLWANQMLSRGSPRLSRAP